MFASSSVCLPDVYRLSIRYASVRSSQSEPPPLLHFIKAPKRRLDERGQVARSPTSSLRLNVSRIARKVHHVCVFGSVPSVVHADAAGNRRRHLRLSGATLTDGQTIIAIAVKQGTPRPTPSSSTRRCPSTESRRRASANVCRHLPASSQDRYGDVSSYSPGRVPSVLRVGCLPLVCSVRGMFQIVSDSSNLSALNHDAGRVGTASASSGRTATSRRRYAVHQERTPRLCRRSTGRPPACRPSRWPSSPRVVSLSASAGVVDPLNASGELWPDSRRRCVSIDRDVFGSLSSVSVTVSVYVARTFVRVSSELCPSSVRVSSSSVHGAASWPASWRPPTGPWRSWCCTGCSSGTHAVGVSSHPADGARRQRSRADQRSRRWRRRPTGDKPILGQVVGQSEW